MSEEFVSSNIENNAETPDIEDKDYFQLIKRLKEISTNIVLLKKTIYR